MGTTVNLLENNSENADSELHSLLMCSFPGCGNEIFTQCEGTCRKRYCAKHMVGENVSICKLCSSSVKMVPPVVHNVHPDDDEPSLQTGALDINEESDPSSKEGTSSEEGIGGGNDVEGSSEMRQQQPLEEGSGSGDNNVGDSNINQRDPPSDRTIRKDSNSNDDFVSPLPQEVDSETLKKTVALAKKAKDRLTKKVVTLSQNEEDKNKTVDCSCGTTLSMLMNGSGSVPHAQVPVYMIAVLSTTEMRKFSFGDAFVDEKRTMLIAGITKSSLDGRALVHVFIKKNVKRGESSFEAWTIDQVMETCINESVKICQLIDMDNVIGVLFDRKVRSYAFNPKVRLDRKTGNSNTLLTAGKDDNVTPGDKGGGNTGGGKGGGKGSGKGSGTTAGGKGGGGNTGGGKGGGKSSGISAGSKGGSRGGGKGARGGGGRGGGGHKGTGVGRNTGSGRGRGKGVVVVKEDDQDGVGIATYCGGQGDCGDIKIVLSNATTNDTQGAEGLLLTREQHEEALDKERKRQEAAYSREDNIRREMSSGEQSRAAERRQV